MSIKNFSGKKDSLVSATDAVIDKTLYVPLVDSSRVNSTSIYADSLFLDTRVLVGPSNNNNRTVIQENSISSNSITSSETFSAQSAKINSIELSGFPEDLFVSYAQNMKNVMLSTDGTSWTAKKLPNIFSTSDNAVALSAYENHYVAMQYSPNSGPANAELSVSTDNGLTWSVPIKPLANFPSPWNYYPANLLAFNGKYYLLGSWTTPIYSSTDGLTWTAGQNVDGGGMGSSDNRGLANSIVVDGTLHVFSNSNVLTTTDGVSWLSGSAPLSYGTLQRVAYGNGTFAVSYQYSSTISYSTDLVTWSTSERPTGSMTGGIAFGAGKFVVLTSSPNQAHYSTDLSTWTSVDISTGASYGGLGFVSFVDGKFIIVPEYEPKFVYSQDGVSWTQATVNTSELGPNTFIYPSVARQLSLNYGTADVTSKLLAIPSAEALLDSPTLTGNVTLPETITIGNVSGTEISHVNGVTGPIQDQLDAKAPLNQTVSTLRTNNFSVQASDSGTIVRCGGTLTITVGNVLPIGGRIDFIQMGSGTLTFAPNGTTVTVIRSKDSKLTVNKQYAAATLVRTGGDYVLIGDLA